MMVRLAPNRRKSLDMRKSPTLVSLATFSLGAVLAVAPIHVESAVAAPPNSAPQPLGMVETIHCGNLACQFQAGNQWYGMQPNVTDTMMQIFQKVAEDQTSVGPSGHMVPSRGALHKKSVNSIPFLCNR